MENEVKQILNNEFPKLLKANLMFFNKLLYDQGRNTGTDNPRITMSNLLYDQRGLIFPYTSSKIVFEIDYLGLGVANYVSGANFIIGEADTTNFPGSVLFSDIVFNAIDSVQATIINTQTQNLTQFTIVDSGINTQIADGTTTLNETVGINGITYSSNGDFAIQLPDTTRPSPQAGMIAFENGVFYACADGINWQVINLI